MLACDLKIKVCSMQFFVRTVRPSCKTGMNCLHTTNILAIFSADFVTSVPKNDDCQVSRRSWRQSRQDSVRRAPVSFRACGCRGGRSTAPAPCAGARRLSGTSTPRWRQRFRPRTQELWKAKDLEARRLSDFSGSRTATVGVLCAIHGAVWHASTARMVCITPFELHGILNSRCVAQKKSSRPSRAICAVCYKSLPVVADDLLCCADAGQRGHGSCSGGGTRGLVRGERECQSAGCQDPENTCLVFLAQLAGGRARGRFRALYGMLIPPAWTELPLLSCAVSETAVMSPRKNSLANRGIRCSEQQSLARRG